MVALEKRKDLEELVDSEENLAVSRERLAVSGEKPMALGERSSLKKKDLRFGITGRIRVSVVVAVYNAERYLPQMLDSICVQTLRDIEIILIDDGSSDGSVNILEEYAAKDSRIRILHQTEQSDGAALARNMGVREAQGEFVSILDADDFFEPDMLEKAYRKARDTGAEIVIYDGDIYDEAVGTGRETGMILRREFLPENRDTLWDVFAPSENAGQLFFMTIGAAWNLLVSRELIERENLKFHSFHHADDLGFVYLGFAVASSIAILPEKLVHYRSNHTGSQAANLEKWPEAAAGAFLELKRELESRGIFSRYRVTFTEMALHYFQLYLDRMPSYEAFEKLYLDWKNRYIRQLEIDTLPDVELRQERIRKIRKRLVTLSPGQYIFGKVKGAGLIAETADWRERIPAGSRILLYGAGKRGKELFCDLILDKAYRIAGWTDQKYKEIGYPVIGIEEALRQDYDHVLVSIESPVVAEKIRDDLIKRGVSLDQVFWAGG